MESLILGRSQPGGRFISVVGALMDGWGLGALMDGWAWSDVPKGMELNCVQFDEVARNAKRGVQQ